MPVTTMRRMSFDTKERKCQDGVLIRRWKGKLLGEDEDPDDVEFWHQEMGIYLEEFPQHEGIFEGIETGESGAGGLWGRKKHPWEVHSWRCIVLDFATLVPA
ncbi:hypothetical protein THAOC_23242 [Thalassiosira oceanica]|uniref:Uncharacterized protein n=1 Tax=Thalassiosira oceanica TaxID=159749 RepID=K0SDT0_THAOC|nr:hypothetical protein THAOC_23242 [Thalassiosira oceanica]|eukprot:EJK56797.1 hypothetical protein THAOC_23242 [Thalassiosira oceanica]